MPPLLDMDTQAVYSSGRSLSGLSGDAAAAGRGFLQAVLDAKSAVVHHTVAAALEAYHGTWSQPANRMAHDVEALGGNTAGSAVDVGAGNRDATAAGSAAAGRNRDLAVRLNSTGLRAV